MSSPVDSAAASSAPTAPRTVETLAQKVQRFVDAKEKKIQNLERENAALKTQLHEARAFNTRIRRIPKKVPPSAPAAQQQA